MTRDVPEAELRAARQGAAGKAVELRNGTLPEDGVRWLHRRTLPDGRELYLEPMGFGMLYLQVSPDAQAQTFDDTWCYGVDAHDAAWRAVIGWDGEGEPEGWFRHPQSGRRVVYGADAPVPVDPAERALLSLQSRWAHPECSREQVASEALAVIRQLTLDACAERERLTDRVQALSAVAEGLMRPPPEVQQVYDLQNRLVPHTDELDRVLGQEDRCLLNWTLGVVHGMHLRIEKLESGQAADDLLRTLARQNDNQAERIRELEKHTMCWHCHDVLTPDEPPHCQACPAFACCDVRNCPQPGCDERMGWPGDE